MALTLSETEIDQIMSNYDDMPLFSSLILARINESWDIVDSNVINADILCKVTKNLSGPSFAVTAMIDGFSLKTGPNANSAMEQVEALFIGVEAKASVSASVSSTHAEANAKVTLAAGEVADGAINYHLGAGVSTGVGIKDDSANFKVAGTGIQVGRKVGVSLFGNEVAVDFGKVFKGLF